MSVSWMMKGSESVQAQKAQEAEAALRREKGGKLYRFYLKPGGSAKITFVDGHLDDNGFLVPPRWFEHGVRVNGKFETFVCPVQTVPDGGHHCPICDNGGQQSRAALVSAFTIIDHRESTGSDGKVYRNQKRLFVCKSGTFEVLSQLGVKRGGIAGWTVDVSRGTKDKDPAVGNVFDFIEKNEIEKLKAAFTRTYKDAEGKDHTVCDFEPADYEKEIVFRTGDELLKLGIFGGGSSPMAPGGSTGDTPAQGVDYAGML